MPHTKKLTKLSAMALSVNELLSIADVLDETLIAAKLSDCIHCIEVRAQEIQQQR